MNKNINKNTNKNTKRKEKVVISFKNVSKIYKLYKNSSSRIISAFTRKKLYKEKKAISNLSFDIKKGEKVAIFGKNGAGKSTIIKLISQISYPTEGVVEVFGKIVTLLGTEVGIDQELTGRENIFLKCILLGMKKEDIKKIESKIIEFAEIEEYIDQPMKLYSSGMRARLGFAISVQVSPDILVIDETLSVGDENFRNKCINKINEIIQNNNTTLVLVTHSKETAVKFCNRGIVIEKGKMVFDGKIQDAISKYYNLIN